MVTEEQANFFDENGYLRYGKVLEQTEIKALIDGLDRVVEIELAGGDDSSVEFSVGHRRKVREAEDEPRVLNAQASHHCLIPTIEVNHSEPLAGSGFPAVG